jgi:hypothetical protein
VRKGGNSPDGRSGEIDLVVGASQPLRLGGRTQVGNIVEHPLFDTDLDKRRRKRCNHLHYSPSRQLKSDYAKEESVPINVARGATLM